MFLTIKNPNKIKTIKLKMIFHKLKLIILKNILKILNQQTYKTYKLVNLLIKTNQARDQKLRKKLKDKKFRSGTQK